MTESLYDSVALKERKRFAGRLRYKYGITLFQYENLLKRQENVCAICQKPCSTGRKLGVDHDHITGAVRGLLCNSCNVMIGMAQDDPDVLVKAIRYLETTGERTS